MSDSVKITAIVTAALLLVIGGGLATCNNAIQVDAAAPVVESCIKHPSTRPPFRGVQ